MLDEDVSKAVGSAPDAGIYGLRVDGMQTMRSYLTAAPPEWPLLTVERVSGTPSRLEDGIIIDERRAGYDTADQNGDLGTVRLERAPLTVRFTSRGGFSDHAMLHPDLGMVATIANYWMGRDAFHAGAFLTPSGAWAVLGAREAGKSSLLGQLAAEGVGVMSDDAVVLDGDRVLAGPRCVDLRQGAAEWLGQGDDLGVVGNRSRHRILLPQVPASVPLRGWIMPVWADTIRFDSVAPTDRLSHLVASYTIRGVERLPEKLLPLIALPFLEFGRPRRWDMAADAMKALLQRLETV